MRQVGNTFVKLAVVGDFDALCSRIVPLDDLQSVFQGAKIYASNIMIGRLCRARRGQFYLMAASKGSKDSKVCLLTRLLV
jgi:hypothetical protein